MNKERRTRISKLIGLLENLKEEIDQLHTEEQEAFDNLSEGLQAAENGQKIEASAESLDEAKDSMDEVLEALRTAADGS